MLALHTCAAHTSMDVADLSASALPARVAWVDLLNADEAEVGFVERATGLHVRTLTELSEIESASRLRVEMGVLYLSTRIVYRDESGEPDTTSVGFVLRHDLLITIRYTDLRVFRTFAETAAKPGAVHASSAGAFVGLVEAIVDRLADVLEGIEADLDGVSKRIFRADSARPAKRRRPAREDADLREILRKVGRAGDLTSKIRDSLLGLAPMVPYVVSLGADWLSAEVRPHLETARPDIASLNDYH